MKARTEVQLNAKKWLRIFVIRSCLVLAVLSLVAFLIDPFFQFRVRDHQYYVGSYNTAPGLIKNHDYDTLILGSSMTQNFNMDTFRDVMGGKPLHIGLGGLTTEEMVLLYDLAKKSGHASRYYLSADLPLFTGERGESRIRSCLFRDDLLSGIAYFLDYEVWFRFIPVDIGMVLAKKSGMQFSEKMEYRTSIDRYNDWSLDFLFGREYVLQWYRAPAGGLSEVRADDTLAREMKEKIAVFFEGFEQTDDRITFFFPPYSVLFWCQAQDKAYYDAYMEAKAFFEETAYEKGFDIYDFQTSEVTCDLDRYKDLSHYNPETNDWMIYGFAGDKYRGTPDTILTRQKEQKELVERFRRENPELFQAD